MASFAIALAAALACATESQSAAAGQYLTFPGFRFPVANAGLIPDGSPDSFDFTHRINMIPVDPPVLRLSGKLVWEEYARILRTAEQSIDSPPGEKTALRFAEATARLGDGRMTPAENIFYLTGTVPHSLTVDNDWTTVALPEAHLAVRAAALSDMAKSWLPRMNTLPQLGDEFIKGVSFQIASLAVLRPWFDPDVLNLRGWRITGDEISDGKTPPRGRLPGYCTRLIVVRNLTFIVGDDALPETGSNVMFRSVPGAVSDAGLADPSAAILELALPSEEAHSTPSLGDDAGEIADQITNLRFWTESELGQRPEIAPRGGERFPVPLRFDVTSARLAAQTRGNTTLVELKAAQEKLESIKAIQRISRFGQGFLDGLEVQVQQALRRTKSATNAIALLDQLGGFAGSDLPHAIALVCDAVARCPNPDTSFFPA